MRLTVSALHALRREEVVRHEFHPLGHLGVLAHWTGRARHRLGEVLHHKLHVLPLLRKVDTDEPVAAADVDKGATLRIHLGEVVAVDEEADLVALAARQAGHGAAHALGPVLVLAEGDEHWLFVDRVEGELEAAAGQRRGLGELPQRLEAVRRGRVDVLGVEAHPRGELCVGG